MCQPLETKNRKKILIEEIFAWQKIERIFAKIYSCNKNIGLFVAEATERKNIIKNEEKMRTLLNFYIHKFVSYDIDFIDDYDGELYIPPRYLDIWDSLVDMVYCIFNIELKMEKYKLNKRIDALKIELDDHYGVTPEAESAASLCKIMEFGYERAEELKLFYEWKDAEIKKIKDCNESINLLYRETKY